MDSDPESQFPFALTIDIPFPDTRLASTALEALRVDPEISTSVRRNLTTISPLVSFQQDSSSDIQQNILRTEYRATTNRMLRVALNGFLESLSVVISTMEELDVDVLSTSTDKS